MKIEVISAVKIDGEHKYMIGRTVYEVSSLDQFLSELEARIETLCAFQTMTLNTDFPARPINIVWREIE